MSVNDVQVQEGLDQLKEGIGIFDQSLKLVYCNKLFKELRNYPDDICVVGKKLENLIRYNADRGDFGPGSPSQQTADRMLEITSRDVRELKRKMADGKILKIRYVHLDGGGLTVTLEDVTEEQLSKQALETSEERYSLLSKAAEQAIYEWDIENNNFYSSPRLSEILQVEIDPNSRFGWSWVGQIHSDDKEHYKKTLEAHFTGEQENWHCEYRLRLQDGTCRWISERGTSVRNSDNQAIRMVAAVTDITEKVEQDIALATSEERYALVSKASSDGLYDWDLASDELFVSDRLNQLFAFDERGVSSRHWANRVHAEDLEHYIETITQHFKGISDYLLCEYRIIGKDGKYHWVRDQAICVRGKHGRAIRLVGAVRDITEEKEAEEKLELAHARFSDAIEALSTGFVLFDADDRLVVCNSKYIEYFPKLEDVVTPGITMTEVIRAGIERDLFPEAGDDPEKWLKMLLEKRALAQGVREQYLDGGLWLHISDHRTKEGGLASIYTDISGLKQRQLELVKAKDQAEIAQREAEEANRKFKEQNKILVTVSDQLAKYISPQLYQSICRGEQKVKIDSKRKKLTIFFSDIANFTEITDQLESEQLTSLLNQYLTEMSHVAYEFGAYFDKFIGDAMIFYFGDPETKGVKQDANDCVWMAIEMQRRLKTLQSEWRAQGLIDQPFETRIGINTGYCTVGNFGSEDRMDYTIIGSEVNLASRLESNAEAGGILLASETYSYVKDWLLAEEQEAISMKGFAKPVRTYRVKGIYDELSAEGRVLRSEIEGLSLTIHLDQLRKRDTKSVITKLEEAITQLNTL